MRAKVMRSIPYIGLIIPEAVDSMISELAITEAHTVILVHSIICIVGLMKHNM